MDATPAEQLAAATQHLTSAQHAVAAEHPDIAARLTQLEPELWAELFDTGGYDEHVALVSRPLELRLRNTVYQVARGQHPHARYNHHPGFISAFMDANAAHLQRSDWEQLRDLTFGVHNSVYHEQLANNPHAPADIAAGSVTRCEPVVRTLWCAAQNTDAGLRSWFDQLSRPNSDHPGTTTMCAIAAAAHHQPSFAETLTTALHDRGLHGYAGAVHTTTHPGATPTQEYLELLAVSAQAARWAIGDLDAHPEVTRAATSTLDIDPNHALRGTAHTPEALIDAVATGTYAMLWSSATRAALTEPGARHLEAVSNSTGNTQLEELLLVIDAAKAGTTPHVNEHLYTPVELLEPPEHHPAWVQRVIDVCGSNELAWREAFSYTSHPELDGGDIANLIEVSRSTHTT